MSELPVFVPGRLSQRNVERLRAVFNGLFALFAEVRVSGAEHLPAGGGFIVCPNHLSRFDAPLLFAQLPGRAVTAFAADTYRPHWFFRLIIESVDAIWVHRGAIGPSTLKAALRALRAGRVLGLAPEGTRSPTHQLQPAKTGAAALATAAGVPIVPVAITGTEHLGPAIAGLRAPWRGRVPITVTFGPAFQLAPAAEAASRAEALEAATTELMCRIAALLPPPYRGAYADHPRLRALLEG